MQLYGLGIGGYRSFRKVQRMGPLSRINLLAGPNNSGKSNVLRFLSDHLAFASASFAGTGSTSREFGPHELCHGSDSQEILLEAALPIGIEGENLSGALDPRYSNSAESVDSDLMIALSTAGLIEDDGLVWFQFTGTRRGYQLSAPWLESLGSTDGVDESAWSRAWEKLTNQGQGGFRAHWLPQTLSALNPLRGYDQEVVFVPAIRQITAGDGPLEASGVGLIHQLARCEQPAAERPADRERFDAVQQFPRVVVGDPEIELKVPYDRDTINVRMDNRLLPLEALGTGIHEVMILAATATMHDQTIICLEEPEIHLHPRLQRELVRYLGEATSNQYFIATHSAHMLDTPGAEVFHVRLEASFSRVSRAQTSHEQFDVCRDLGYRASDLLQANCVVWVEGPSDRIYLLHWLRATDPGLEEGLDFSIMFYGGRLLSHLTADDPEVESFISLRRLNRNLAIVIDSDRHSAVASINLTKQRVISELDASPGYVWVTDGREIENYLTVEVLKAAIKEAHPKLKSTWGGGKFDEVFPGDPRIDKVKIARAATRVKADLGVRDLGTRIGALTQFIRSATSDRDSEDPESTA